VTTLNELFPERREPCGKALAELWSRAIFVIDSNILLKMYELPEESRSKALAVFETIAHRLWLPFQAAVEYERNRFRRIVESKDIVRNAIEPLESSLNAFVAAVDKVQLANRGKADAVTRMDDVVAGGRFVIDAAKQALESHIDPRSEDPIRDIINRLFDGRIGTMPEQATLNEWFEEAKKRFDERSAPGWMDQDTKGKNPRYRAKGLVLDKRYGDFVIWKEMIDFAKSRSDVTHMVLISADVKQDWLQLHNQVVGGPHPALCTEIMEQGGLDGFWKYDFDSFLAQAAVQLGAEVSHTTIQDVASVAGRPGFESSLVTISDDLRDILWIDNPSMEKYRGYLVGIGVPPQHSGTFYVAGEEPCNTGLSAIRCVAVTGTGAMSLFGASNVLSQIIEDFDSADIPFMDIHVLSEGGSMESHSRRIRAAMKSLSYDGFRHPMSVTLFLETEQGAAVALGRIMV